jgi:3-deoxy-D-manno-octulosonic-acid transferase
MGGCTHPGEEEELLRIWSGLRSEFPGLRLVLAPRHVERAAEVEELAWRSCGVRALRWSGAAAAGAGGGAAAGSPLVLVDVIGELDRFYRLADVVFVGGSLVPRGGHNLLEPARLGKPVLFGPSTENFEEIAAHLLGRGAGRRVAGPEALAEEIRKLLASPSDRERLGASSREAAGELAGATARHVAWILRELEARRLLSPLR